MVQRHPIRWSLFVWIGLLFSQALPAAAVLPMPVFPQCGAEADADPVNCPSDFGEPWHYISYIKDDYLDQVRGEEVLLGSGIHLDRAFAIETGDFSVTIASLDSGIEWDEGNLRKKWKLNAAELPVPLYADGSPASSYDLDGDGLFTVDDYAGDPRVDIASGNDAADGVLEPSDLIAVFSEGVDEDANGYVDDICGWDFLWNDNDPFDDTQSQGYSHGTIQLRRAAAEGDDGGSIGACPNCSVMMLRIGDSFIAETSAYAQAMLYGVDMGVKVLQVEIGGLDASDLARDAIEYAWSRGVTVVASAADETSIHANMPSALHHTIVVHPVTHSGLEEADATSFLVFNNCSDFGGRPTLSISNEGCSSEATAIGAGMAGLIHSAALHEGISLTSNEIHQLFIQTADDIYVPEAYYGSEPQWYPSRPGFDRYFGYGRANVRAALDRILDRTIPPEADLIAPDWFQVLDPTRTPIVDVMGYAAAPRSSGFEVRVEYGVGLDPESFTLISSLKGQTAPLEGLLARWDLRTLPKSLLDPSNPIPGFEIGDDNVTRVDKINSHTVTLRVRTLDAAGRQGEMRKTLYVHSDPDSVPGFPVYLGASQEASSKLADLDGDGRDEIVQVGSDGTVHVLRGDGSPLAGWPVRTGRLRTLDPNLPGNHLAAPCYRVLSPDRAQSVTATPALGDLDRDGTLEIVVATFDGGVFAWHSDGAPVLGFPVTLDYSVANQTNAGPDNLIEDGFFTSPVLGDLDGDGFLDIIAAAMDQQVYAWDRNGVALSGWPVQVAYPFPRITPVLGARIMYPPAVGDVDGDGTLDVAVGTGEVVDFLYSPTYLIHGEGNNRPGGPFHRGWPILTHGLYTNILPVIGTGTASGTALADLDNDGRLEVATHSVAGFSNRRFGSIYTADGEIYARHDFQEDRYGILSNVEDGFMFPLMTSGAFGDLNRDGSLDYTLGMCGWNYLFNLLIPNRITNYTFSTAAWDATSGELLAGFPQVISDMQFFSHQVVADVSGDGFPETISSNGAFTVHAFNLEGTQPERWPKFTGQWGISTPAVGDLDGDGYLELVQATRSGYLYAWKTGGRSVANGGNVEWGSYHRDLSNSGNYHGGADPMTRGVFSRAGVSGRASAPGADDLAGLDAPRERARVSPR